MQKPSIYGKGLRAVLKALYEHRTDKLSFREICRLSKLTQPTVLKHLKRLEATDVIKSEQFKNLKLYFFKKSRLAFHTLASLDIEFLRTLPKPRGDAIEDFVKDAEPRIAILFGSTAKGTFEKSSDIDLLLIYDKTDKYLLGKLISSASIIEGRYGVPVRPISMPLWEFKKELKNKENFTMQSIRRVGKAIKNGEEYYELIILEGE